MYLHGGTIFIWGTIFSLNPVCTNSLFVLCLLLHICIEALFSSQWDCNVFIFNFSALELNADDPLVLKRRADVRGKLGKKKEAVQDYRQAIELQGRIKYLKTGK